MAVWHVGFSSAKRGTPFPGEDRRRKAVRALTEAAGDHLVLFSLVHEHNHTMLWTEGGIDKLGADVQRALNALSEEPLVDPWTERVDGTRRKEGLLRYFLQQPSHHNIGVHDALWTGSCFQDLAGARVIDGFRPRIWDLLPHAARSVIYRHVRLPRPVEPVSLAQVRVLGAVRLMAAASAALTAAPRLRGRTTLEVRAKAAVVHLGERSGLSAAETCWALGIVPRTYRRLRALEPSDADVRAVRQRLALEEAVASATGGLSITAHVRRLHLLG